MAVGPEHGPYDVATKSIAAVRLSTPSFLIVSPSIERAHHGLAVRPMVWFVRERPCSAPPPSTVHLGILDVIRVNETDPCHSPF
jgi:hypothetical protein